MGSVIKLPAHNHFGECPKCKKNDGHLNIGRNHWYFCRKHRVKWHVGSDLFPDWHNETEDDWRRNPRPEILPAYCTEYVIRTVNKRRQVPIDARHGIREPFWRRWFAKTT